jgi:hypothetical protein
MKTRERLSVVMTGMSIIGFLGVLYAFYVDEGTRHNTLLFVVFGVLSFLIITERFITLSNDILSDREWAANYDKLNTIYSNIELLPQLVDKHIHVLPHLLAVHQDIVIFPTELEAIKYCLSTLDEVSNVKNTVLRYGHKASNSHCGETYLEWMKAKHNAIENDCKWTEIVSNQLNEGDPQEIFIKKHKDKAGYSCYRINDKNSPMMQMTICRYKDNRPKEVLFGHESPAARHGTTFLTRNQTLVEYFEGYFNHCVNVAEREASEEQQKLHN